MHPKKLAGLRTVSGLLFVVVIIAPSCGFRPNHPGADVHRSASSTPAAEGPVIDGRVNDAIWQSVEPFSSFTQQDPIEGAPASEKTEVRIIVGKGNVYVSVIAFDSDPSKIIVSQARRDASLNETDSVVMVFDTFNDNQNAFVFGTNPLGIEYDGQVAREGQTSGVSLGGGTAGGTQRGGISAFNPNWDGDWTVKSQITERGWETEMAIPLKTLRYQTGTDRTWGFNVVRNIRHKNEQVYLAPIPRGFDIYRVSLAAKMSGLDLPARRDIKLIPYALGSVNKDYTRSGDQVDRERRRRARREVGNSSQPDARRDHQHRLRAGRGRRRAGQPDALRSVLSGKAAVLPRERVDVPVRQSRSKSTCSSRAASACRRRRCRSTFAAAAG